MRRQSWLAAALLLAPWLVSAPVAGQAPKKQSAGQAQDVVFLAEARPLLIRIHTRVDGQPLQAAWDDFMKHLFRHLDVNGDGVLSKAEAARAPALDHILNGSPGAGLGFGFGGTTAPPALADLDADGDGKVTPAELAAYYRKQGFVPFQFEAESKGFNPIAAFLGGGKSEPPVEKVRAAIFDLLDTDGDGKLTKDELTAAPEKLLRLDADDDGMVTAREVAPDSPSPNAGAMFGAMAMGGRGKGGFVTGNKTVLLVTTPGAAPAGLVDRMQERYGPGDLSRKALGLDEATFAALDTNGNGKLDAAELAGFVKRAPDLELVVRLGTRDEGEGRVEVLKIKGRPAPLAGKVKSAHGLAQIDLGATRAEVSGGESYRTNRLSGLLRQQFAAQFRQADKDGNGYIDEKEAQASPLFRNTFQAMDRDGDGKVYEKEFTAYLDLLERLQARARAACVALVLEDQSRGLFDLLDTDRDGRLGLRELRGAAGLLEQLGLAGKGHLTQADLPRNYRLTVRRGPARKSGFDPLSAFAELYSGADEGEGQEGPATGPAWFRKMDRNRDGDVSRAEFLGSDELFRRIDTDGDGLISAAEAERYDALHRKRK